LIIAERTIDFVEQAAAAATYGMIEAINHGMMLRGVMHFQGFGYAASLSSMPSSTR